VSNFHLEQVSADHPDAILLSKAMGDELGARYDFQKGFDPQPRSVFERTLGGQFLVGYIDDLPVACGGYRMLETGVAEIRQMFVVPEHRGKGFARDLLDVLETFAIKSRYRIARLETGTLQPDAIHLYSKARYRTIDKYGPHRDNPRSICFEKAL
jgi:GNAT superfamily N-acetyltransferase